MTWRTHTGDRVLTGAEATLVKAALAEMLEYFVEDEEIEDQWSYGIELFDSLPIASRIALLAEVGHALLNETAETPFLTAHREATVAAIYACVEGEIHLEIDMEADAAEAEESEAVDWRL